MPESQSYNTCLNRKVSIDPKGFVKNCPSTIETFGNVEDIKLKDLITNKEFIKMWGISKDQVLDCKVCEYRYICTCLLYTSDAADE